MRASQIFLQQPPPPYSTLENRRGPRQKLSPPSHPDLISQSDKGGGKRKGAASFPTSLAAEGTPAAALGRDLGTDIPRICRRTSSFSRKEEDQRIRSNLFWCGEERKRPLFYLD